MILNSHEAFPEVLSFTLKVGGVSGEKLAFPVGPKGCLTRHEKTRPDLLTKEMKREISAKAECNIFRGVFNQESFQLPKS